MHDDTRGRDHRRRWLIAAAVVALVASVAFAAPRLLADETRTAGEPSTDCVGTTDAPTAAVGEQQAAWVRFCPVAEEGSTQRIRHPRGVITGDLAATVATSLWQTQVDRPVCAASESIAGPTGLFRIEVGLADGRVAEIAGDTGCSTRDQLLFSQLETTLLMSAAGAGEPLGALPTAVTCPRRLTVMATTTDGTSADLLVETEGSASQSTVPLLPLPAVAADVCAYSGAGRRRELVEQWQVGTPVSESIRALATTDVRRGAMTDCPLAPEATSYVVVLTDATGTARTLALDPTVCATLQASVGTPPVDTYLGLASPSVVRAVARSRP